MDCHDARLLLALSRRGSEFDKAEQEALTHHLDACPDCAAGARADEALDRAFGAAMCAVAVPAGLKRKILDRVAAQPTPKPWKWIAAAAAVVLTVIGLTGYVYTRPLPVFDGYGVRDIDLRAGNTPDTVEEWFAKRGVEMIAPRDLDYQHLTTYDVTELDGKRVPKLIFYAHDNNGPNSVYAQVLILRRDQFDIKPLPSRVPGTAHIWLSISDDERSYVFLIMYKGDLNLIMPKRPNG